MPQNESGLVIDTKIMIGRPEESQGIIRHCRSIQNLPPQLTMGDLSSSPLSGILEPRIPGWIYTLSPRPLPLPFRWSNLGFLLALSAFQVDGSLQLEAIMFSSHRRLSDYPTA